MPCTTGVVIHELSSARFDEVCAGPVGSGTIEELRRSQYSRRRLLLAALVGDLRTRSGVYDPDPAWRTLAAVEELAPRAVEDVLMWPTTGIWLVRMTRRMHGVSVKGPALANELGFLHSLAAAAAIRAGVSCALDLTVLDEVLTLPTVGQVRFQDGIATDFQPTHRHRVTNAGQVLDVEIDDRTPYRWFAAPEPPHPLEPDELSAWRKDLDHAWELLTRWHPGFAAELTAGLVTLAPVPRASGLVGASAGWAFGATAVAKAESPVHLAATLVHEMQHSKLNAVLDLVVLHTRDDDVRTYAPWRDDPRPLTGLLHGIYAFTSTVEFWWAHRTCTPEAAFTFVHRRMQVEAAIEDLATASDLTESGARLVASAAQRLRRCSPNDVSREAIEKAKAALANHWARWGGSSSSQSPSSGS